MKIYFVGYLTSRFIQDDAEILDEDHELTIFDLSKNASSFKKIHAYLISTLLEWKKVYNTDIVLIWFADYPALPFMILSKLFGKSVVVRVAGWEVYSAPSINYGNQLSLIRGAASRWILRNATVCVTPSIAYENIVKKLEPDANVITIPQSVDIDMCECPIHNKTQVVTALTSMKFTRDLKGIPTFEKATEGMDCSIIENIPHSDLIEVLKSAKVYCQLSYTESFGMALLESMACGCIPVVTDRDALPEVVGECGFVVPYGDVEKTREAITIALKSDASDIKAIRERAKLFSRERKIESQNKMLEELCNH